MNKLHLKKEEIDRRKQASTASKSSHETNKTKAEAINMGQRLEGGEGQDRTPHYWTAIGDYTKGIGLQG